MTIEVKELRAAERYVLDTPLSASFGSSDVQIVNIGAGGVQIVHALPLRIGSSARLWFRLGEIAVTTNGRLLWSHLAKPSTNGGKLSYQSGIRVDDVEFAAAVRALVERGYIKPDDNSLEKKRQRLIQKERERSDKHLIRAVPTDTNPSSEQLLLIQHARERLRLNPAEADRLYERARTTDAAQNMRQDIVAVWEYLERTIALPTILRVFEGKT